MRVMCKVMCLRSAEERPITRRFVSARQIVASCTDCQVGRGVIVLERVALRTKVTARGRGPFRAV